MRSMGSNVVFLRWPSVRDYRRSVPSDLRDEVEAFSRRTLCEITDIVEPQEVVSIGFKSLDGDTTPDLVSAVTRALALRFGRWVFVDAWVKRNLTRKLPSLIGLLLVVD